MRSRPCASGVQRGCRRRRQRRCSGRGVRGAAGRGGAPGPSAAAAAHRGLTGCAPHNVTLVCNSACPLCAHLLSLWPAPLCSQARKTLVYRMGPHKSIARRGASRASFVRRHAASEAAGPGRGLRGLQRPAGRRRWRHAGSAAGGGSRHVAGRGLRPGCADGHGRLAQADAGSGTNSLLSASQRCVVCSFLCGAYPAVTALILPGCFHPQSVTPNCAYV